MLIGANRCDKGVRKGKPLGFVNDGRVQTMTVHLADGNGANPTTCPSLNKTKSVWKKCCKDIQVNAAKTVNKPRFKKLTILRNNNVSAEQALLMREATDNANATPNNACVEVYCVERFVDGTVMHPSGKNKTAVSEEQSKSNCKNGMKGNCKVKQPKKDCCKTWELDQ